MEAFFSTPLQEFVRVWTEVMQHGYATDRNEKQQQNRFGSKAWKTHLNLVVKINLVVKKFLKNSCKNTDSVFVTRHSDTWVEVVEDGKK